MAFTINFGFYCVLFFVFIQGYYARGHGEHRQPHLSFHHVCAMKMDEGPCKAALEKFYFNIDTGYCESFVYGGCQGNENNFDTLEECEEMCMMTEEKNPCHLPDNPGPCRGLVPRYFFDRRSQKCTRFFYGGCYGNANNFRTLKECQAKCQQPVVVAPNREDPKPTKHVQQPPAPSNVVTEPPLDVRAHAPAGDLEEAAVDEAKEADSSDSVAAQGPNLDQVELVTAAPETPTHSQQQVLLDSEEIPPSCLSPVDRGTCEGSERRYVYNPKKKRCQLFRYSGCGGNKNNFIHKRHCMKMCMKGHGHVKLIRIKKKNSHLLNPAD
ncbi:tissue factor pathway inhibitor a isoform X2 [Engraulis encrasicolus]|uniref:tissue factor pathway inhibitor a isoform X2 n=1 Tax=Engraulis encrasicolus TaxID=184585 RepID=UPI002FD6C303